MQPRAACRGSERLRGSPGQACAWPVCSRPDTAPARVQWPSQSPFPVVGRQPRALDFFLALKILIGLWCRQRFEGWPQHASRGNRSRVAVLVSANAPSGAPRSTFSPRAKQLAAPHGSLNRQLDQWQQPGCAPLAERSVRQALATCGAAEVGFLLGGKSPIPSARLVGPLDERDRIFHMHVPFAAGMIEDGDRTSISRLTVAPTCLSRRSRHAATALLVTADIFSLGSGTASRGSRQSSRPQWLADFLAGVTSASSKIAPSVFFSASRRSTTPPVWPARSSHEPTSRHPPCRRTCVTAQVALCRTLACHCSSPRFVMVPMSSCGPNLSQLMLGQSKPTSGGTKG